MAEHPNTAMVKESKVKLKSSDDKIFEVNYAVAMQSQVLKNALADTGCTDSALPLHNVSSEILAKVIEYWEYHVNAANTISKEDVKMWDQEFVKHMDRATLLHLLMAAYYLDIDNLKDLLCETVSDMIQKELRPEVQEVKREG